MFRRANKITSLLVAAAAVVSLVPTAALASDVKKIDSQEGTVYNAVAYKDGKALIDGEVDDNDATYYYADGKYTELDDIDSGSDYYAYGDKYAKVNEDGDYFVDLTNGSVTDDTIDEDDADDAASALRKKVKSVDRYNNDTNTIAKLTLVNGNKFGHSWYETTDYTITGYAGNGAGQAGAGSLTADMTPTIYTDKDGNYIDADYNLGKVKVETTYNSVTVENTVDTEKDLVVNRTAGVADLKSEVSIQVTGTKTLGQDKDYIYRYAVLKFNFEGNSPTGKVKVNNKEFNVADLTTGLKVVQKISKSQASDNIEDAKYAKTVYNYIISNDDAAIKNDEATFIQGADAATVVGGKLVAYKVTNSDKDNVVVQAMSLKQKNGYYYTDLEDETKITAKVSDELNKTAFDTDVDGNLYVIDGGYIKKFDGTDDWDKIYKVDGSFDSLSVYDKDNMVAWSQDDEVYSVIGGKTTDDTTPETPVVTAGWAQAADGTWSYNKADGTKATGWYQDATGTWYFLNAAGVMQTGWYQDATGTWYHLQSWGGMSTGWFNDNGTWYHLQPWGGMSTGWINDNGTWYYLNGSGAMLANTTVNGYKLAASGAWIG